MKKLGTGYLGFAIGVVFGAIVATTTSYSIFKIAGGDLEAAQMLQIQNCLLERINE